jgi:hypothetical protein
MSDVVAHRVFVGERLQISSDELWQNLPVTTRPESAVLEVTTTTRVLPSHAGSSPGSVKASPPSIRSASRARPTLNRTRPSRRRSSTRHTCCREQFSRSRRGTWPSPSPWAWCSGSWARCFGSGSTKRSTNLTRPKRRSEWRPWPGFQEDSSAFPRSRPSIAADSIAMRLRLRFNISGRASDGHRRRERRARCSSRAALPGEGKTTIAANLAVSLAGRGPRRHRRGCRSPTADPERILWALRHFQDSEPRCCHGRALPAPGVALGVSPIWASRDG